jgi:hypothetical protein
MTTPDNEAYPQDESIHEPRLWRDGEWTATVIKNEDDEGWAVAMTKVGEAEPALVGPWTMGRDKKNPKPLDTSAFNTLVKTAAEVLRRHEQQLHSQLHREVSVTVAGERFGPIARVSVTLDIVPDEDDAHAMLRAYSSNGTAVGDLLGEVRVAANFKLNVTSASAWIENGFRKPI